MQEETFLFDGFDFSFGINGSVGSVERVGYERRDGAEDECGEVKDAGGEDVGFSRGISVVREKRGEGVDVLEVQGVCSALVELRKMLFVGYGFHGWDRVRRFRGAAGGCLFRCLRGAG